MARLRPTARDTGTIGVEPARRPSPTGSGTRCRGGSSRGQRTPGRTWRQARGRDNASVPSTTESKVFRTELNPVHFLHRAAYMYPAKTALVDGERRFSYGELAERSWRQANALRSAGLQKGDRVATLLFNSAPMLGAHFGVPAAGGVLVAINHRLASAEVGHILEHSGAR